MHARYMKKMGKAEVLAVTMKQKGERLAFRKRPLLPEVDHEILKILKAQHDLKQFRTIKCLAETPTSIHAPKSPQADNFFFSCPSGAIDLTLG